MPNIKVSTCRFCGAALSDDVIDLKEQPPSNAYVKPGREAEERRHPLRLMLCGDCRLAQLDATVPPDAIFNADYAYFSSYADSWVEHARRFCHGAIERWGLGPDSRVVEAASNDGYLLQHFVAAGVPALGVEPAAGVAATARARGVPTEVAFFGRETARRLVAEGKAADLAVANNVLAHVPDVNDFVGGFAELLKPAGVLSIEFPHLLRLLEETQFDTIYHEHYFCFSLATATRVLARHGLTVFDVEELPTHGGSLRVWAGRADGPTRTETDGLRRVRELEAAADIDAPPIYRAFAERAFALIAAVRGFLDEAKAAGKTVAGYGAAAKGNTLLNAVGADRSDLLFVADRNPHKQGLLLPGSHIPVVSPERLLAARPDYVLILPWNLRTEIVASLSGVRDQGGRFVTAAPRLEIF